jgi:C4-dicarboxylate-specific signal transduction histidine kinase
VDLHASQVTRPQGNPCASEGDGAVCWFAAYRKLRETTWLQRMLLMMNAIESTSDVGSHPPPLRLKSARLGDVDVPISMEDSGVGIDAAGPERIFKPLFTTKPRGMGVGLSICRSIIDAHHGRISSSYAPYGAALQFVLSAPACVSKH